MSKGIAVKTSYRSVISSAAVAIAALASVGSAAAGPHRDAHAHPWQHAPAVVNVPPPAYAQYGGEGRWGDRSQQACRVQRWDPQVRYMPGEAVRRHGQLYVATRISGRVWNVNSPPEWTPNYWAPAQC
jgi:hypothetical protein